MTLWRLWSYHYTQHNEHTCIITKFLISLCNPTLTLFSHPSPISRQLYCHYRLVYSVTYRNGIIYTLSSFTWHNYFESLPWCYVDQWSIAFCFWVVLFHYTDIKQFVHPFTCWCTFQYKLKAVTNKAAITMCVQVFV